MSFGISVGDFLAVGRLVADIASCLRESGGSRDEYQGIVRELECVRRMLDHLENLSKGDSSPELDSIKHHALSCRQPLEEFLARIQKYSRSLSAQTKSNAIKGVIDRIGFPLNHRDDIRKLQTYLNVHLGSINVHLAEHGLNTVKLAADRCQRDHLQIKERLGASTDLLSRIQMSIADQGPVISKTMSVVGMVFDMLSGKVNAPLQLVQKGVESVGVLAQQIYTVVLDIQTTISKTLDVRWTFFQDPILFEDALGRKFPVPSEYDYSLLVAIIQQKFQKEPGADQVVAGDFEIMDARNTLHVLSPTSQLRPGSTLIMAMLVSQSPSSLPTNQYCPIPECRSAETIDAPGGGQRWYAAYCFKLVDDSLMVLALSAILGLVGQKKRPTYLNPRSAEESSPTGEDYTGVARFKNVKLAEPVIRPTAGDAVLIAYLENGRDPEMARCAGSEGLFNDSDSDEELPDDNYVMSDPLLQDFAADGLQGFETN